MPSASFTYQHTTVCFFGHTHVAGAFVRDDGVKRVKIEQLMIEPAKKYFINTGSVGQPRDGDWRAAYCIYHIDSKRRGTTPREIRPRRPRRKKSSRPVCPGCWRSVSNSDAKLSDSRSTVVNRRILTTENV